jgi:hypothetical protein
LKIGHISLAKSFKRTGEHFVALVETLDRRGVEQHVIVRNSSLAGRVEVCSRVTVAPTTASPVIAYCLMPAVDVVHVHDETSAQAGLLLVLTRSMPYVATRRRLARPESSPLVRSIYRRAAGVICTTDAAARTVLEFDSRIRVSVIDEISRRGAADFERLCNRIAAQHLRLYAVAADSSHIPALLL